ncbi:MAG: hypothetical protein JRH20_12335 [Deltaproteobacteria bacterium]|nr:hypothetical protein [Deltaproteobacteria bacterium]
MSDSPLKKDPPPVKLVSDPPVKKDPTPVKKDPPPKPKPTHCTVELSSTPSGAKIRGGGKTPKSFRLKIGKSKRVKLSLRRYKSRSVSLSCGGGDRDVALEKKVKARDMNKLF